MSHKRLERLESAITVSHADRGSCCPDCGGLGIEDAMNALHTLDQDGTISPWTRPTPCSRG